MAEFNTIKSKAEGRQQETFITREKLPAFLTKIRSGEALAGMHLTLVARFTTDAWARRHLTRHSADEMRHALVFEQIARQLDLEETVSFTALDKEPRKDRFALHELTPVTGRLYTALLDGQPAPDLALGPSELRPVIRELHRAEKLGLSIFHGLLDLLNDNERGAKIATPQRRANASELLMGVIEDERYHIAWTANALQRWQMLPEMEMKEENSFEMMQDQTESVKDASHG